MSFDFLEVLDQTAVTIIAASTAVVMGVLTSILSSKTYRQKQLEVERVKQIQETLYAKLAERQAQTVDTINEKIPSGVSKEEFEAKIADAVRTNVSTLLKSSREGLDFVGDLVNGYHQQALSQARVQFWFSVTAASVGFIYILYAATRASDGTVAVILNTLPGVVIDAVAFLFFRQAEQTRERATALYDRLRQDSQVENAQRMVESIDDIQVRSLVKAQIALHMSGLSPKELDLQAGVLRRVG